MNNSRATTNTFSASLFAMVCGVGAGAVIAEDIVPARVQSDEQISVWVNNASLDVFVSQLAQITGREATIGDKLQGEISGRFSGTMLDTLNSVGAQYPILFDLDDSILGVVAEAERSNATIALGEVALDDQIKGSLLDGMLSGNTVDIRDDEVVVSGHPSFVNRVAKVVTLAVARSEPVVANSEADGADDPQLPELVIDAAVPQLVDSAANEILPAESAEDETASASLSSSGDIRSDDILWVTDIPGYETF